MTFDPTDATNSTLYVVNSKMRADCYASSTGGALTQATTVANTGTLVYPSDLAFDAFDNLVVSDSTGAQVLSFRSGNKGRNKR